MLHVDVTLRYARGFGYKHICKHIKLCLLDWRSKPCWPRHSFSHWFGGGRVDICCTYPSMYQSRHPTVQHFVTDICAYFRDKIVHCYYCLMHRWLCEVVFWDKLWNSNQTTNKYVRKFAFEMIFCSGFRMLRTPSDTRAYCIHNAQCTTVCYADDKIQLDSLPRFI